MRAIIGLTFNKKCNKKWSKEKGTVVWCDKDSEIPRTIQREGVDKDGDEALDCYCIPKEDVEDDQCIDSNVCNDGDKYIPFDGCNPDSYMCQF